jgi:hypothetical protein
LIADGTAYLEQPQGAEAHVSARCAVSAEVHALVARHSYLNPANVMLDDPDVTTRDAGRLAAIGGSTIVDVTCLSEFQLEQRTVSNPAAIFAGSEVLP